MLNKKKIILGIKEIYYIIIIKNVFKIVFYAKICPVDIPKDSKLRMIDEYAFSHSSIEYLENPFQLITINVWFLNYFNFYNTIFY